MALNLFRAKKTIIPLTERYLTKYHQLDDFVLHWKFPFPFLFDYNQVLVYPRRYHVCDSDQDYTMTQHYLTRSHNGHNRVYFVLTISFDNKEWIHINLCQKNTALLYLYIMFTIFLWTPHTKKSKIYRIIQWHFSHQHKTTRIFF